MVEDCGGASHDVDAAFTPSARAAVPAARNRRLDFEEQRRLPRVELADLIVIVCWEIGGNGRDGRGGGVN